MTNPDLVVNTMRELIGFFHLPKAKQTSSSNPKGILYDVPLIQQHANECWLYASSMACARKANEVPLSAQKIASRIRKELGINIEEALRKGLSTALVPAVRETLAMQELDASCLKEKMSYQERYNRIYALLIQYGPLIINSKSPMNPSFKHDALITGVYLGLNDRDEEQLFLLINSTQSIHSGCNRMGTAQIDAFMIDWILEVDDEPQLYTPPLYLKQNFSLVSEAKFEHMLARGTFGSVVGVPKDDLSLSAQFCNIS